MRFRQIALLASALLAGSTGAQAATLIHAYDFSGSGVTDSVGGVDGTLVNGASVSGGLLHLDGSDDYVQLGGKIIPTDGSAYSVYIKYDVPSGSGYGELISQGSSGGPGFYIGYAGAGRRITDQFLSGVGQFDFGAHDLLLTTKSGETKLWIDGANVLTLPSYLGITTGGTDTRFGAQFSPYGEFVGGTFDAVRIYSDVVSYADAVRSVTVVPEQESWALMICGLGLAGGLMRRQQRAQLRFA